MRDGYVYDDKHESASPGAERKMQVDNTGIKQIHSRHDPENRTALNLIGLSECS